jgi:hypothetical protein
MMIFERCRVCGKYYKEAKNGNEILSITIDGFCLKHRPVFIINKKLVIK